MLDDEWMRQANEELRQKPCPNPECQKVGTCEVDKRMLPTHGSLAGQSLKVSVWWGYVMSCSACGIEGTLRKVPDGEE